MSKEASSTGERAGIAWMLLAACLFVCNDAAGKKLVATYPIIEIMWFRYAVQLIALVLVINRHIPRVLISRRPLLQIVRGFFLLGSAFLFMVALSLIPIADALAISFLVPLFASAIAIVVLKEKVEPKRWIGIAAGFAGAIIIIRPDTGIIQWGALAAVASALVSGCFFVVTRPLGQLDGPRTTLLYTAITGFIVTGIPTPFIWVTPDLTALVLSGLLGLSSIVGHFAAVKAFTAARASVVSPLLYTELIWAIAFGVMFFDEIPDTATMAGALAIVAAGLFIYRDDAKLKTTG